MKKPTTIAEVVEILDNEMMLYDGKGVGLGKYRRKDYNDKLSRVGYIWSDIPVRYVSALTGLTKEELEKIHRLDKNGSISMGPSRADGNLELLSISVFGSR